MMDAPERATEIKAGITAIIAILTALWGWLGWAVIVWIACILLDYLAGSFAAKKANNWSSAIARSGLWHKLGEIFAVLVAALCDIALRIVLEGSGIKLPFEVGPVLTPVVLIWYTLTEVGSILENCGKLGAPVPSWFKQKVDHYKDSIDQQQGGKEEQLPTGKHEKVEYFTGPEVSDPDE